MTGWQGLVVISLISFVSACGGSARPMVDYRTSAPLRQSHTARPTLAGFVLGASFGGEALRCTEHTLRFAHTPTRSGGYCEQPLRAVGYAVHGDGVYLHNCNSTVCRISVQIERVGETQLQEAVAHLEAELTETYGAATNHDRANPECLAALASGHYSCLLYGEARLRRSRTVGSGAMEMRVEGADGSERALITLTLGSEAGWDALGQRDL